MNHHGFEPHTIMPPCDGLNMQWMSAIFTDTIDETSENTWLNASSIKSLKVRVFNVNLL